MLSQNHSSAAARLPVRLAALLLSVSLLISGCSPALSAKVLTVNLKPQNASVQEADEAFLPSYLCFSARLLSAVYEESDEKTLLLSPLSVMTALTMTGLGAEGNTAAEIKDLLVKDSFRDMKELAACLSAYYQGLPSSKKAAFSFADSIWLTDREDFTVSEDFLQENTDYFKASVFRAPFDESTVRDINEWVAHKTDGMIPQLLERLDPADLMLLINALCFEADWTTAFTDISIRDEDFTTPDGDVQTVSFLHETFESSDPACYLSDENTCGFLKTYGDGEYAFIALLPDPWLDLGEYIASLTAEKLTALLFGVRQVKTSIALPAFRYSYDISLKNVLGSLGMADAFSPQADFSGISSDYPLSLSDGLHKTFIQVDSGGTRAAAATAVILCGAGPVEEEWQEVRLNRPFLYMIVDTQHMLPIFIGTVTEVKNE